MKIITNVVILFSCLFSELSFADKITFAFSEGDPPLSFENDGKPVGLFPELVALTFHYLPNYEIEISSYPWPRAQLLVENGQIDGFITYPSTDRKKYALFAEEASFIQDFGYLIYPKNSTFKKQFLHSKSFDDFKGLKVILENGSEWEEDNIPNYINHVTAPNLDTMMHLLVLRREGDFMVMPPENAKYLAKKFGYEDKIEFTPVTFINDSMIPFHIGLSKKNKKSAQIISELNRVIQNKEYIIEQHKLVDRYR